MFLLFAWINKFDRLIKCDETIYMYYVLWQKVPLKSDDVQILFILIMLVRRIINISRENF